MADIDECALAAVTGLQACQPSEECRNSPGSFSCSCPEGYAAPSHGRGCEGETPSASFQTHGSPLRPLPPSPADVDECSAGDQCRRELGNVCVNTPGSFVCRCQPGFRAEAPACVGEPATNPPPLLVTVVLLLVSRVQTASQNPIFSPSRLKPSGSFVVWTVTNHVKSNFRKTD